MSTVLDAGAPALSVRPPAERVARPGSASMAERYWLVNLAGVFYAIAMHKYLLRDALSSDTGIQGYLEVAGIMGAFACVALAVRGAQRRFAPTITSLCFAAFVLFELASGWRSFSPALSTVKAVLMMTVLATAYLAGQTGLGARYLRSIYWTYIVLVGIGLVLGLLLPTKYPLFEVDDFSGRTKLTLFATHPGILSETCALLILLAPMLPKKPHWSSVVFLFGINFLGGEKAATGVLVLFLLLRFIFRYDQRRVWRTVAILATVMLSVSLVAYFIGAKSGIPTGKVADAASKLYGNQTAAQAGSLDGRAELWRGAIGLLSDAQVLGYGVEGARERLIHIVWWSGQAHNGYIEAALDAGVVGACFLFIGLAGIVLACLRARREFCVLALPLVAYELVAAVIGGIFTTSMNFGLLCLFSVFYLAKQNARVTVKVPVADYLAANRSPVYGKA